MNDPNRKGELFGLENLLKFKDGSFMSSLWKAADNPNQEHDINDLAKELDNIDKDQLDNLAEEGDEGPTDTRLSAKKKMSGSDIDISDEESDVEFNARGINHGDLFSKNKGGAQIAQGDDDFEEEMGGQSQVLEVATRIACEGIKSDIEDEDDVVAGVIDDDGCEEDSEQSEDNSENSSSPRCNANNGAAFVGADRNGNGGEILSQVGNPENSPERTRPEFSDDRFHDCSPFSLDGLRTQPTQTPTSTQKESNTKNGTVTKVSLMGTVFESSRNTNVQPAAKQNSDLYIPTYSKRKN